MLHNKDFWLLLGERISFSYGGEKMDPLQVIGVIELFIASGISLVLGISIIKRYQERPSRITLIFIIDFILIGMPLSFVAIDRLLLVLLKDTAPGLLFHNLAVYISLGVILLLDIFAFEMTYPTHVKKLTIIIFILLLVAGILLYYFPPAVRGVQREIFYDDMILYLALPFLVPPIFIPIIVFFYYSLKIREESLSKSNRTFVMGIAGLCVAIGYFFELMGIMGLLVIIVRLTFVIFTFLMYIAFTLPKWFQKLIGLEES